MLQAWCKNDIIWHKLEWIKAFLILVFDASKRKVIFSLMKKTSSAHILVSSCFARWALSRDHCFWKKSRGISLCRKCTSWMCADSVFYGQMGRFFKVVSHWIFKFGAYFRWNKTFIWYIFTWKMELWAHFHFCGGATLNQTSGNTVLRFLLIIFNFEAIVQAQ